MRLFIFICGLSCGILIGYTQGIRPWNMYVNCLVKRQGPRHTIGLLDTDFYECYNKTVSQ